jgi:uncharacterized protein YeaO (DUF488 family)
MVDTMRQAAPPRRTLVLTVGHSTRAQDDFVALLKAYGVKRPVDVRAIPRSRHNPQFNRDRIGPALRRAGISKKGDRHTMIKLKRVYEPASSSDGARYLVERLWPRGMKKTALRIDAWLKDVAPSTTLRRWFNHDPKKWGEFQRRYRRELNANPDALRPILNAAQRGNVTLVYSSHDAEHNNAVVLKEYVEEKLERKSNPPRKSAA